VLGLEGVGDVLEEVQAQDDVLVLRRVHIVAERVSGGPELGFKTDGSRGPRSPPMVNQSGKTAATGPKANPPQR
jgi:hypothetical protein